MPYWVSWLRRRLCWNSSSGLGSSWPCHSLYRANSVLLILIALCISDVLIGVFHVQPVRINPVFCIINLKYLQPYQHPHWPSFVVNDPLSLAVRSWPKYRPRDKLHQLKIAGIEMPCIRVVLPSTLSSSSYFVSIFS